MNEKNVKNEIAKNVIEQKTPKQVEISSELKSLETKLEDRNLYKKTNQRIKITVRINDWNKLNLVRLAFGG